MHRLRSIGFALLLWGGFPASPPAATFTLNDGSTLSGEIVPPANGEGLNVRVSEGVYRRVPWTSFTQPALQELARDPKLAPLAEPYLEVPEEQRIKKTEGVIKEVPRLNRPAKGTLASAFFSSSVGLVALLLLYAANLYAGYEIAICRARPVAMVCGAAALLPVIGPLLFLSLPTGVLRQSPRPPDDEDIIEDPAAAEPAPAPAPARPVPGGLGLARTPAAPAPAAAPTLSVFQRGQFTFNRRFFETRFSDFFGVIRRDAEKDRVLVIRTPRGTFVANRITRIAADDLHVEVRKGKVFEEVMLPFAEIQEIRLEHQQD